jgi:serine protein kinase
MSSSALDIKSFIGGLQDLERYKKINWEGSFQQYVELVRNQPEITRNAFQRLYDCINHFGGEDYVEFKKKITSYNFFKDPIENGKDAVFGIDVHLQKLVNVLKAAAQSYGTEKRVILLHGPVGSAKSTIAHWPKRQVLGGDFSPAHCQPR